MAISRGLTSNAENEMKRNQSFVLLVLCAIGGTGSILVGQDASGDLRNYHYYNAFALLHKSPGVDVSAAQMQSYLNPVLDLPYYLLSRAFPYSPRLVAFILGVPAGILAFFGFRIVSRLFNHERHGLFGILVALALGLSGSATLSQLGLTTNEIPVGALVVAGLDCLLVAIALDSVSGRWVTFLSGLLTGLALGGKLTAIPYVIALPVAAVAGFGWRRPIVNVAFLGAGGILGTMVTGGYWFVHLIVGYGNPLFPYHNEVFHSAFAANSSYADGRFFPSSTLQWLFYPFWWLSRNANLVTEYPFADARFAVVFVIGAAATVAYFIRANATPRKVDPGWRTLIVFWAVSYVVWLKTFSIYRYTVPLEMVGSILVVGGLYYLLRARPASAAFGATVVSGAVGIFTVYPDWGHIAFQSRTVPVDAPLLEPNTMVVAAGDYPMAYVAFTFPASTPVIGAFTHFVRPPETPETSRPIDAAVAGWAGSFAVLRTRVPDKAALAAVKSYYHFEVLDDCHSIHSAWDEDALELCKLVRVSAAVPSYALGTALTFNAGGTGLLYAGTGWANPEPWGRWSLGQDAELTVRFDPGVVGPLKVVAEAFALTAAGQLSNQADIYANDRLVAHWALGPNPSMQVANLPSLEKGVLRLRFHVPQPLSPAAAGSSDYRQLGVALVRLTIVSAPP
ncbi:MAG: hypothetical protein NVSMB6_24760 [Burkholderiaceae bacterium]